LERWSELAEEEQVSAPSGAAGSPAGRRAVTACTGDELRRRGPGLGRTIGEGWSAEDRVALIGALGVDVLGAFLAVRDLGLCPVPLESSFTLEETAFAINDSGARHVVLDRNHLALADQLRPLTPYVEAWTVLDPATRPLGAVVARLGDPCGSLHYSAAATGRPVGYAVPDPVVQAAGRRDLDALLGGRSIDPGDRLLLATSLSDSAAVQLAVAAVEAGALLVLGDGVEAAELLSAFDVHRPTVVHLTPATAVAIVKAYEAGAVTDWVPQLVLITAPGCPPTVTHGLVQAWGTVVRIVYIGPGVGALAAVDGVDVLLYPGSVGAPLAGADGPRIRIAAGESGSGLIEAELPPGSGSWMSWGDRGILSNGRLTVLDQHHAGVLDDRRAAMPGAVEAALVDHPWVADAAVVAASGGRPGGLMTYVQATSDADPAGLEQALIESLRERLPVAWIPERIAILPSLPRTGTGKLDRRRLRSLDPFEGRDPV